MEELSKIECLELMLRLALRVAEMEAEEKGAKLDRMKIILRMLDEGLEMEDIIQYTDIDEEELEEIKEIWKREE